MNRFHYSLLLIGLAVLDAASIFVQVIIQPGDELKTVQFPGAFHLLIILVFIFVMSMGVRQKVEARKKAHEIIFALAVFLSAGWYVLLTIILLWAYAWSSTDFNFG